MPAKIAVGQELQADGDPNQALLQELSRKLPTYVALHEIQNGRSLATVQGLAHRFGREMKSLQIRQRSTGHVLASIPYVDLDLDAQGTMRVFACDIDATAAHRQRLTRSLLAFSTMAVLIIPDQARGSVATQLEAWRQQMMQEPWINRHMLVMPMSSTAGAVIRHVQLGRSTPVAVRVTPAAPTVHEAWKFLSGAWGRVRSTETRPSTHSGFIGLGEAPARTDAEKPQASTDSLSLWEQASGFSDSAWDASGFGNSKSGQGAANDYQSCSPTDQLEFHVQRIKDLDGVLAVNLFDVNTGLSVAKAGSERFSTTLAQHGMLLLSTAGHGARMLGCGESAPDITVQWADKNLVLRHVPNRPHLAIAAITDTALCNPASLRTQWMRLDAVLSRDS
jgi:hypothetical protein